MKFLADENIPYKTVLSLRDAGFDITWIGETSAGAEDSLVLNGANEQQRILITFDKDFVELVFRKSSRAAAGVILLRVRPQTPQSVTDTLKSLLDSDRSWEGFFSAITETKIRMVPLPR